jgi:acyl-CoA thioesterase I
MKPQSKTLILFQGDSITDAGRNRSDPYDLGNGYVKNIAQQLGKYPDRGVLVLNRGISGDRIRNLRDRWQQDCLDLKPDVVTILIGINDAWESFFLDDSLALEKFEADYTHIINLTRRNLDAKIVLMEPFLLPVSNELAVLRDNVDSRIKIVKKLSKNFQTELIELDKIFIKSSKKQKPEFYSLDGVHPTPAGHALIAQSWLNSQKTYLKTPNEKAVYIVQRSASRLIQA